MKKSIILFIAIFFTQIAFSQSTSITGKTIPELREIIAPSPLSYFPTTTISNALAMNTLKLPPQQLTTFFKEVSYNNAPSMPKAWAYEHLAFFCKLEVIMEKKARFPIKMRLGEVQYVEQMEGKY